MSEGWSEGRNKGSEEKGRKEEREGAVIKRRKEDWEKSGGVRDGMRKEIRQRRKRACCA